MLSPQNNRKVIKAWTFYDWANSAYSLIITSAIFPAYYTAIVPEQVPIGNTFIARSVLASYAISISFVLIAILSPILSSIADSRGNKKSYMRFFCYIGSLACMAMYFFTPNIGGFYILFGLVCSIIASIGYCGSIVFYNAFLPEIASKEEQDKVSAKGFAMGYIGSVLLMLMCIVFIQLNEQFYFLADMIPVRLSFVAVGVWWFAFAQIPLKFLPEQKKEVDKENKIIYRGFYELKKVWNEVNKMPVLKQYLLSFFLFNMGVQTVMYMATYFAKDEIKMESSALLYVVLIIQLVAIAGAWIFAKISKAKGNYFSLVLLIIIWIVICVFAYNTHTALQFYCLAFAVGMVMGGIQSMSRSTYSKLLPPTQDTASYFSFYDVCEKIGIVIGTLTFGLVAQLMGGMRNAALALAVYFVLGLLSILFIGKKHFEKALTNVI